MTKLEILMAICETPGWQPPDDSSSITRALGELQTEGWIIPRLDGFEATAQALDIYPHFETSTDSQGRVYVYAGPQWVQQAKLESDSQGEPILIELPMLSIGPKQRVEGAIEVGALKGGVMLVNGGETRLEVEVTLVWRPV